MPPHVVGEWSVVFVISGLAANRSPRAADVLFTVAQFVSHLVRELRQARDDVRVLIGDVCCFPDVAFKVEQR